MLFADVGKRHSGDNDHHRAYLYPFQVVESHQDGGDYSKDRQQVLIDRHHFRIDIFNCRLNQEVCYESRAKKNACRFTIDLTH